MTYRGSLPPTGGGFPGQQQQQQQQQQYASQHQAGYQTIPSNYGLSPQQQQQQQQHRQPHQYQHPQYQHQYQHQPTGVVGQQGFYQQQQHGQYFQPQHEYQQVPVSQPYGMGGVGTYSGYQHHGGASAAGGGGYAVQLPQQPAVASYVPPPQAWQTTMPQQQQQAMHSQPPHHSRSDTFNTPPTVSPQILQQQQLQSHRQSPQQRQHQQLPSSQPPPPPSPSSYVQLPDLPPQSPQAQQQPQQQPSYVNLQDIQQQPPYQQPLAMGNVFGTIKKEEASEDPKAMHGYAPASAHSRSSDLPVKGVESSITVKPEFPRPLDAKNDASRSKSSPRSSISNSPAPSIRSPSISKKSPAVSHKSRPFDTVPVMMAIAEECIDRARASVHDVAMSMHPEMVDEYQKLMATSLACFEAALQSSRLAPREEARVRLRYAAILQEETENLMEAETTLSKGITLCDKHRLFDLKYSMQYLLLKVLFQRNHKAALIAVDRHISDCEAFKHVQWFYAFRLLKATFYIETGSGSDASAFENIRSIQTVATSRGDNALSVFAALLEALALLKTPKDGHHEKLQACLAHVGKFQLDPTVQIVQLSILTSLIEVASMLNVQHPDVTAQSLRSLQKKLDECDNWHNVKADFLLPVKRQPSAAKTISNDTMAIIRAGHADIDTDFLVMSFMTKMELRSLVFTFSGLASLHKPVSQGRRSTELWREGIKILDAWDTSTAGIRYGPSISLEAAVRQRTWRLEAQAYLNILLALLAASHCQWDVVKQLMSKVEAPAASSKQAALRQLSLYLSGVYFQGTGDLQSAARIFSDARFNVPQGTGAKAGQSEIALLASMNRLWIMQHPSCRDDQATLDLIELLQPLCANHANIELRIAWHNVAASLVTEPPQQLNQRKQHMHAAIAGTKITNNFLGAAVTLCIMRSRFFENVIGEQALKSALAAAKQAQKSGNLLWQSVADGMLAQSYEVQGQRVESAQEWEKATNEAKDAFSGSS